MLLETTAVACRRVLLDEHGSLVARCRSFTSGLRAHPGGQPVARGRVVVWATCVGGRWQSHRDRSTRPTAWPRWAKRRGALAVRGNRGGALHSALPPPDTPIACRSYSGGRLVDRALPVLGGHGGWRLPLSPLPQPVARGVTACNPRRIMRHAGLCLFGLIGATDWCRVSSRT